MIIKRRTFGKKLVYAAIGIGGTALGLYSLYNIQPRHDEMPADKQPEPSELSINGRIERTELLDHVDYRIFRRSGGYIDGGADVLAYSVTSGLQRYRLIGIKSHNVKEGGDYSIFYLDDKEVTMKEIMDKNIRNPMRTQYQDMISVNASVAPEKTYVGDGHAISFLPPTQRPV